MLQDVNSNNNPEATASAATSEERYPGVSIKNTVKEEHYSRLLHKSASETEAMLGAASTPAGSTTTTTSDYGESNDFNTAKGALKKQAAAKAAAVVNPRDDALPTPQVSGSGNSGSDSKTGYVTGVAIPNTAQKEAMAKIAAKTGAAVNPKDDSASSGKSSGRGLTSGVAVPNPVQKDIKNRNTVRTKGYGQWR
ncbi:MAG: hypothetical protein HY897_22295 [Deltaproteobacteria bacterium]|nr:hypothetical protein [Deltaproteobacteria bacterium]